MKKNFSRFGRFAFVIVFLSTFVTNAFSQTIVYSSSGATQELLAAKELRRYVYLRTNQLLSISPASSLPASGDLILVAKQGSPLLTGVNVGYTATANQTVIKSVNNNGRTVLVITGYDEDLTLKAVYRFAEKLGCYFDLAGDILPDTKTTLSITGHDEVGVCLFNTTGIQPFHDFHQGPDIWDTRAYKSIISQLPKMGMNFIGLKTYPKYSAQHEKADGGATGTGLEEGPEPVVWVGHPNDVNSDGTVKFSYPAFMAHSHRPHDIWGTSMANTGDYYGGAKDIFPQDYWGSDVMGTAPFEQWDGSAYKASLTQKHNYAEKVIPTPFPAVGMNGISQVDYFNNVFNKSGQMLADAFKHAHDVGVKTALGTELPLGLEKKSVGTEPEIQQDWVRGMPQEVQDRIKTTYGLGDPLTTPSSTKKVYEGIFKRLKALHQLPDGSSSLDYYWLWTWEVWQNQGIHDTDNTQIDAVKADLALARDALQEMGNPFQIGTAGWFPGARVANDFESVLTTNKEPMMGLWDQACGGELSTLNTARPAWACTWLEEDWGLNQPQLGLARIYNDAKAAADMGAVSTPSGPVNKARGFLAKHWRTRVLSSNTGAMKNLSWQYGTTSTPPAGNITAFPTDMQGWLTSYYGEWMNKMFGLDISNPLVAKAISNFVTLEYDPANAVDGYLRGPKPIYFEDTVLTSDKHIGGINYWSSHWEPYRGAKNSAPAAIMTTNRPYTDYQNWLAYTFVDDFAAVRSLIPASEKGNLERFDYFLKTFEIYREGTKYAYVRYLMRDVAAKNNDWVSYANHRKTLASHFENIMKMSLEKATSLGDIGEIMSYNLLDWHQLVRYEFNGLYKEKTGQEADAQAGFNPSKTYTGVARIGVVHPETMVTPGENYTVECFTLGEIAAPTLYYRSIGSTGAFTQVAATSLGRKVYSFTITNPTSDFEYYIQAGSSFYPVTANNTSPIYQTVVVAGTPVITNQPPSVSITNPPSGTTIAPNSNLTISATASDSDGTVTKVEFYQGSTKLGEATAAPYSYTWNNVPAGNYTLTAVATDNEGATSTSPSVIVNVAINQSPSVSITSPANNAGYTAPANVSISATAADTDGSVSKVEFYQGSTKLGEATAAPYSYTWNNVAAGSYALTAVATDNEGATTTSTVVNITVANNQAPSVSITSPANNASFNAPASVSINASASDADGSVSKVEFYQGSTKLGEATAAPYSYTWDNVSDGTYALTAVATDNSGATATSSTVNITVESVGAWIKLDDRDAGISYTGDWENISEGAAFAGTIKSAEGSSSASYTFTGTQFRIYVYRWDAAQSGTISITNSTVSNESFSLSSGDEGQNQIYESPVLPTGSHTVTITSSSGEFLLDAIGYYSGGSSNQSPTVSISSPANNATFTTPTNVTINANAADVDGTVTKVEFYQGSTKLGEDLTSPYSFTWSSVVAGSYSITAIATDNAGATTTSSAVNITVSDPVNQSPTVSISSPANNATFTAPTSVTINATAADSDGSVTKVEFYQGSTKLGEDLTSPYSFTWNNVAEGSYTLTAVATDNANATTTSSVVNITVNSGNSYVWDKIDDRDAGISYSGTWLDESEGAAHAGTIKLGEGSASASYTFTGTQFRVYVYRWDAAQAGTITISNSSVNNQAFSLGSGEEGGFMVYESPVLPSGSHTVTITRSSGEFMLDALEYFGETNKSKEYSDAGFDATKPEVYIYPNPVVDNAVNIRFQGVEDEVKLKLIDLSGKVIINKNVDILDNELINLSLEGVSKGIYILSVQSEGVNKNERLIIE